MGPCPPPVADDSIGMDLELAPLVEIVQNIIHKMANNKTCSDECLVAEMLKTAIDDVEFAAYLTRALLCEMFFPGQGWLEYPVAVNKKQTDSVHPSRLRPISTLPVLYKVLSLFMLDINGLKPFPLFSNQFAFRTPHQTHEPVFILRRLVEVHEK